jgi:Tol biopolymer transport system component
MTSGRVRGHRRRTLSLAALLPITGAVAVLGRGPVALGQSEQGVELVSIGTNGFSAGHQSGSDGLIPPRRRISGDGRFVVFESYAGNVVCVDGDFSTRDIFVRDRLTGAATVGSVAWDGGEANHNSFDPVISADGRYVAFASQATNLVPGDTNGFNDIFVRDLQTGTNTRVSVSSAGEQSNSVSHGPAISADGRYVAFYGGGSNLVPGDTNGTWDVFVRDTVAGTTERVSISTAGAESPCCASTDASITADGRYVAFLSQGRLDPSVNNNGQEIYVRDRVAGTTTLVRPAADGSLSNGIRHADISADGRFIAFQSSATNIVPPDANGSAHDVFVKDLVAGTTTLVSQATDGTQGNHDSWMPSISANGRYVAFHSWANNLVPGDTNTQPSYDVFVRDTLLGTTTRVNLTPAGGEADGSSTTASISADGSLVYFESTATNLYPNDLVNGFQDVFLAGPRYPGGGDTAGASFRYAADAYEGGEPAGAVTITVMRTGSPCSTATVQFATADGTATAGSDYTPSSGTLTFLADQSFRTFEVSLLDDGLHEPDETVPLTLINPTGGPTLGNPSAALLTILDDDEPVNRPPSTVDDAGTTAEDTALTLDVLANDADPDGDPLGVVAVTQGAHGAVADNGNGTVTYTPAVNFGGSDTFQYTAADGRGGTDTASVAVTVTPVDDAPFAALDWYATPPGVALQVGAAAGVLANDSDPEGDALTAAAVGAPEHGTLTLATDGSFTYTPEAAFTGFDSFTYRALDSGQAGSAPARATIRIGPTTSSCRPVTPVRLHPPLDSCAEGRVMGNPFLANRRLTPIEDGTVPCVEVDTLEATRCLFRTDLDVTGAHRIAPPAPSGPWLEDFGGQRYAVVGQPVTRDGSLASGAYVVGTEPDAEGTVPCVGASGQDAPGMFLNGIGGDLSFGCTVESMGAEWNFGGGMLQNHATRHVGTSSLVHPDGVAPVSVDPVRGVAWYTGRGAALNDTGGMERDEFGVYYDFDWACHLVEAGGVAVPAAKRPSTRSFPAPGSVNVNSPIRWLVANPYVTIANDPPDPRAILPPTASFTASVGLTTIELDASASAGDIAHYLWDLEWVPGNPNAQRSSPTVAFPVAFVGAQTSGWINLTVVTRFGYSSSVRQLVEFNSRIRRLPR